MKTPNDKNNPFDLGRWGKGTTTKLTMRATIALLAASASAAWCPFAMSNPAPIVNPSKNITVTDAPTGVPFVDIGAPAGPLTHVYIGGELSCQVAHILDGTVLEFFPPGIVPGDCGTFIATGGTLYAPDFDAHGVTATAGLGPRVVFTPTSQVRTGTGTAVDPFKAVTLVSLPTTALSIHQTDTYVAGDQFYRTDVMIINNGGPATGVLYRAGDAFLAGSDAGFGFTTLFGNRKSVGCSVTANNLPADRIEEWIPLTGPNNYYEDTYSAVWARIATKMRFLDSCACASSQDNGAGISWDFSIPALGSATFSHLTSFPPGGTHPLVTSKTAIDQTTVARARNDYTITIENPNLVPVTLSSITDTLPAGFSYITNLTSDVTTSNPIVSGQMLTWNGPFVVPAGGSVSLSFAVIVASMAGDYLNEAGGEANGGYPVAGTGPTAPIAVTACPGTILSESFDQVTAPALPAGWDATPAAPGWATSTTNPDTPSNAAFVAAPATISDALLESPEILITSSTAQVSFRSNFELQDGFDGGVLEVSINGGPFNDILSPPVGGTFVTGGYNAEISPGTGSPIAGQMAWSGSSCGYVCTVANLGAVLNGQTIRLRFRMGSDNSVASTGWRVDTIQVLSSGVVCGPCLPATLSPDQLLNISTRALVGTQDKVLIAGFIVTGKAPKTVAVRGIGPSLAASGVPNPLADPTLELYDSGGNLLLTNDNWRDDPAQEAELQAVGLAPTNDLESAMVVTLPPCASYTAILAGRNGGTGVGLVEIYDLNPADGSELANISTRGFVEPGANVMIGGFILGGGSNDTRVAVRGMGPSLPLNPLLADPTLELRGPGSFVPIPNNDWMLNPLALVEFPLRGLVPLTLESGIFTSLSSDLYTAILSGGTGFGLVEIYNVH